MAKVNPDAHAQGLQIKVMAKRKLSYFDEKAVLGNGVRRVPLMPWFWYHQCAQGGTNQPSSSVPPERPSGTIRPPSVSSKFFG